MKKPARTTLPASSTGAGAEHAGSPCDVWASAPRSFGFWLSELPLDENTWTQNELAGFDMKTGSCLIIIIIFFKKT